MPNTRFMNGDRPLRAWLACRISRGLDLSGAWLSLNVPSLGRIYVYAIRGAATIVMGLTDELLKLLGRTASEWRTISRVGI